MSPPIDLRALRTLITHEWLYTWGGAERCLEQMLEMFPQADLLVGVVTERMRQRSSIAEHARETWIGRFPGARTHHRWFLPLHALAFASYDTTGYDLVISSSHAFAKFIRRRPGSLHVCYCYSPPRYLWDLQSAYEDRSGAMVRATLRVAAPTLRWMDRRAASGVDEFVSISSHVAARVRRAYGRASAVVYPPVQRKAHAAPPGSGTPDAYLLFLGRLVPYKRVDLAIAAAERLGMRLIVAGEGPERPRLERQAGRWTEFVGEVSEERASQLLSGCAAFVFPAEEDFGIAPIEANAHGRPVVCYARGGATETMIPHSTAEFHEEQTVAAVVAAIERCMSRRWDAATLQQNATRFSPERFRAGFAGVVQTALSSRAQRT